jgi:hypothetical protein
MFCYLLSHPLHHWKFSSLLVLLLLCRGPRPVLLTPCRCLPHNCFDACSDARFDKRFDERLDACIDNRFNACFNACFDAHFDTCFDAAFACFKDADCLLQQAACCLASVLCRLESPGCLVAFTLASTLTSMLALQLASILLLALILLALIACLLASMLLTSVTWMHLLVCFCHRRLGAWSLQRSMLGFDGCFKTARFDDGNWSPTSICKQGLEGGSSHGFIIRGNEGKVH